MVVLVGYASAHGATQGIAERIAARLAEQGHRAEVLPLNQVDDITGFDALVLGSAIHNQLWLPEATDFVRRNLEALARRPVWLFSVGMLGDRGSTFAPALARLLRVLRKDRKETAEFRDVLRPRDHRAFVGAIERDQLSLVGHLNFKVMGGRYGDHRNWQEIDAWADGIARDLPVRTVV